MTERKERGVLRLPAPSISTVHTRTRTTRVGVSSLVSSQDKGREALNVATKYGRARGWPYWQLRLSLMSAQTQVCLGSTCLSILRALTGLHLGGGEASARTFAFGEEGRSWQQ